MNDEKKKYIGLNTLAYYNSLIKLALQNKVDKVEGKGLSSNDLTDDLKQKILNAGDSSFSGNYNDLTNKPTIPTNNNQLTNGAGYQTEAQVNAIVQKIVGSAPAALDTLKELADALGNDANFSSTITTELSKKINSSDLVEITNAEIDEIVAG